MQYWHWLVIVSLAFVALERLRPRRAGQALLRPEWSTDLLYLFINGHWLSVGLAMIGASWLQRWDLWLQDVGIYPHVHADVVAHWPFWARFLVAFLVLDFTQWCVHNLLHRVPALWAFHKVHHSVTHMDWAANFRFHFAEVLVYRTAQYLPLAFFGFGGDALLAIAVVSTVIGHFNHSNLRVSLGPLRYVFNSPAMHLWHHHDEDGPRICNLGISLSLWDWIFGTAWMPPRDPTRLGFDGVEAYPRHVPGHALRPFVEAVRTRSPKPDDRATV